MMTTQDEARKLLSELCRRPLTTRRIWLEAYLQHTFPDHLRVEVTKTSTPFSREQETRNFVLQFGRHPDQLVIGAHYDVVDAGVAADQSALVEGGNDNTAATIEVVLAAQRYVAEWGAMLDTSPGVTFVLFDHEEWFGSEDMGSKRFIENHPKVELAVVLDVSGIGDLYWSTTQTNFKEEWQQELLMGLKYRKTPPSDSMNFLRAGIPTTLICALPADSFKSANPPEWAALHTPADRGDKISLATIDRAVQWLMEVTRRVAGFDAVPSERIT